MLAPSLRRQLRSPHGVLSYLACVDASTLYLPHRLPTSPSNVDTSAVTGSWFHDGLDQEGCTQQGIIFDTVAPRNALHTRYIYLDQCDKYAHRGKLLDSDILAHRHHS